MRRLLILVAMVLLISGTCMSAPQPPGMYPQCTRIFGLLSGVVVSITQEYCVCVQGSSRLRQDERRNKEDRRKKEY
ncbi:hypothetical protein C0Q70_17400 [Pomacea canaliculata]|uniref:Uncharacterized protein n=1 Tax=Pomacea canaliculata TaxID=400727 RepID=A0A2T7NKB4_POMCA|nr:hypothetical protein C0Q70_17400 [Pomacea canaliculata]